MKPEVTLRELYKLRHPLKSRMGILSKVKENHYKNSVHSRGVLGFIEKFLDPFCTSFGFNKGWNYNRVKGEEDNHINWGMKGQMQKLVVELRLILKNEGDKFTLTYDILCKLVTEYYPKYEKISKVRNDRGNNRPYADDKRLHPAHLKLERMMLLEEKYGLLKHGGSYYNPYIPNGTTPRIVIKLP